MLKVEIYFWPMVQLWMTIFNICIVVTKTFVGFTETNTATKMYFLNA